MEHERQAQRLAGELSNGGYNVWVGDVDVHYAEVCVLVPREMPCGFLEVVSQYGDMRVEGIRGDEVEVSILI